MARAMRVRRCIKAFLLWISRARFVRLDEDARGRRMAEEN
jgi:hypothetical protein